MSYFAFVVSVLMGMGSLAYVYAGTGLAPFVRWFLILGALWLFAGRKCWTWFSTMLLLLLVTLAGIGLWFGLSPGWMISGALGGLMAWDLTDFMRRLRFAPLMDDTRELERRHLTRLTIVALVGVSLASIAIFVRLEFTFAWGVVLTLVAVLGITQLVAWLRRS
jgi:hypothetical protein